MTSLKFRPEALNTAESIEKYTELVQVVHPQSWIILFAISLFIFFVLMWSLFAKIPIYVNGEGILVVKQGIASGLQTAIIYIKDNDAAKIPRGAQVLITPYRTAATASSQWTGQVISMDTFIRAPNSMMSVVHSKQFVEHLVDQHLTTALTVQIRPHQGSLKIHTGIIIKAKIKIKDQAPINLVLPTIERL